MLMAARGAGDEAFAPADESVSAGLARLAAFQTVHSVIRRVHSSLDLTQTLDAVARGVIKATGFGVVVVNLVLPDGDFQVVSVEGDADARSTLLGHIEPAVHWADLLDRSRRWGGLRYIDHADELASDDSMFAWVPDIAAPQDPQMWHPMDSLFAPLRTSTGAYVNVVKHADATRVDITIDATDDQLELLSQTTGEAWPNRHAGAAWPTCVPVPNASAARSPATPTSQPAPLSGGALRTRKRRRRPIAASVGMRLRQRAAGVAWRRHQARRPCGRNNLDPRVVCLNGESRW